MLVFPSFRVFCCLSSCWSLCPLMISCTAGIWVPILPLWKVWFKFLPHGKLLESRSASVAAFRQAAQILHFFSSSPIGLLTNQITTKKTSDVIGQKTNLVEKKCIWLLYSVQYAFTPLSRSMSLKCVMRSPKGRTVRWGGESHVSAPALSLRSSLPSAGSSSLRRTETYNQF